MRATSRGTRIALGGEAFFYRAVQSGGEDRGDDGPGSALWSLENHGDAVPSGCAA